jgi:transcriptional regulator with GAF, ATPase, and Fis domain
MARLIICGQDGKPNRIYEAEGNLITIGRSSENHLQIDDLNSSRHHCEIHEHDGVFELLDKDSRNGIFINGHRVKRHQLAPGDKLEIGTTIIFFEDMGTETLETDDPQGKQTVDISTGVFSPPDDPTGVGERISATAAETVRINRPDAITAKPQMPMKRASAPTEPRGVRGAAAELAELRRLMALNKLFNTELNLRKLLEKVMDTVIEVSGAERGFLILQIGGGKPYEVKVSRNIDRESIKDAREKISNSLVTEVLAEGRSVLLSDASEDSRYSGRESILSMKLRSVLVVPMAYRDSVSGAIYLDNRFASNRFDERCREQLELVADQAAIAIENANLFEENSRQKEALEHAREELERLNQLLRERVEVQDRELNKAREALAARRDEVKLKYNYDHIITRSPKMLEIFMILDKITDSNVPVLVQGESGTGKELIARAIHYNGERSKQPFLSENCAAIPAHLMESEFFGYVRGAFTGANADKMGLFEAADGGTLFLDEVGDMDLDLQTKMLRVLQDGVLRRVGSKEFKRVDVRIISATNRDLLGIIKDGRFREDLYYRLNVINIVLPPLRERKEDVPLLVEHFLQREAKQSGQPPRAITNEALDVLLRYDWPGNVREIENEIMRACALSQESIKPEHLSKNVVEGALTPAQDKAVGGRLRSLTLAGRTLKELVSQEVDEIEEQVITEILKRTKYKKSKAAQVLGISRPTLDAKIEKFSLTREKILSKDA